MDDNQQNNEPTEVMRFELDFTMEAYRLLEKIIEKNMELRAQYLDRGFQLPEGADVFRNALQMYSPVMENAQPGDKIEINIGGRVKVVFELTDLL